jgi:hypothetical protein
MQQYKHLLEDAAKYSKGDLALAMVRRHFQEIYLTFHDKPFFFSHPYLSHYLVMFHAVV